MYGVLYRLIAETFLNPFSILLVVNKNCFAIGAQSYGLFFNLIPAEFFHSPFTNIRRDALGVLSLSFTSSGILPSCFGIGLVSRCFSQLEKMSIWRPVARIIQANFAKVYATMSTYNVNTKAYRT